MYFRKRINYIYNESIALNYMQPDSNEEYILGEIKGNSNSTHQIEELNMNIFKHLYIELNTGAQYNVLSYRNFLNQ